jgi:carbonic anhydrase
LADVKSSTDSILAVAAERRDELKAAGLSPRPRRHLAILTCMDARIDIFPMLELRRGDAHIIRNAGGLVTDDAIRSLATSQRLLGTTEIVVIMHQDCGLNRASDADFARELATDNAHVTWQLGAFDDIEATLRASLAELRANPALVARDRIRGLIFDPDTGTLTDIERPAT